MPANVPAKKRTRPPPTEADREDEARSSIANLAYEARELLRTLSHRSAGSPQDERDRKRLTSLATEIKRRAALFELAADAGRMWEALDHALFLGLYDGQLQAHPTEYHLTRRLLAALDELSATIAKHGKGPRAGGEGKRLAPIDELWRLFNATNPNLPRGQRCAIVARQVTAKCVAEGIDRKIGGDAVRKALFPSKKKVRK